MQIGLGTVQFGLNYGVSNTKGQVSLKVAEQIIAFCRQNSITLFDTAAAYGNSEEVLGRLLNQDSKTQSEHIITKLPPCADLTAVEIEKIFYQSLDNLKRDKVYGLLLHSGDDLLSPNGLRIYQQLLAFKSDGLVDKIGVSVYQPASTELIIERFLLDLVQLPINVLDQRFTESGTLTRIKDQGIEIHARSAFLQGLLLMNIHSLPKYLARFESKLKPYFDARGEDPIVPAVQYIKQLAVIDRLIVGVTSQQELAQIVNAMNQDCHLDFRQFACSDERLILPTNWTTLD